MQYYYTIMIIIKTVTRQSLARLSSKPEVTRLFKILDINKSR